MKSIRNIVAIVFVLFFGVVNVAMAEESPAGGAPAAELSVDAQAQLDAAIASGDEALIASVIAGIIAANPNAAATVVARVAAVAPQFAAAAVSAATNALPAGSPQLAAVLSAATPAAGGTPAQQTGGTPPALAGDRPSTAPAVSVPPAENPSQASSN